MNKYSFKINGVEDKEFLLPTGRHEVTLEQWNKAYTYLSLADEARQDEENGDIELAHSKIVKSICGTISSLSTGIEYSELLQVDWDKINNVFLIAFDWLQRETPKKEFNIKGKKFIIPNFMRGSAGDFQDCMDMLRQLKENEEADKGLLVAAIYMRQGEYYQDLQEINQRIAFLKEYGRMDLFYSCGFFFLSSLKSFKIHTRQPLIVEELEKLTQPLNAWATTLYLRVSQKHLYSRSR
jgi:hypothetical protein